MKYILDRKGRKWRCNLILVQLWFMCWRTYAKRIVINKQSSIFHSKRLAHHKILIPVLSMVMAQAISTATLPQKRFALERIRRLHHALATWKSWRPIRPPVSKMTDLLVLLVFHQEAQRSLSLHSLLRSVKLTRSAPPTNSAPRSASSSAKSLNKTAWWHLVAMI